MKLYFYLYLSCLSIYRKIYPSDNSLEVYGIILLSTSEMFYFMAFCGVYLPDLAFNNILGFILYMIIGFINYLLIFKFNSQSKLKKVPIYSGVIFFLVGLSLFIGSTYL